MVRKDEAAASTSGASTLGDLRRLADWLGAPESSTLGGALVERVLRKLGRTAVPLLGRALRSDDARRREAGRRGLGRLADGTGARACSTSCTRSPTTRPPPTTPRCARSACSPSTASTARRGSPMRARSAAGPRSRSPPSSTRRRRSRARSTSCSSASTTPRSPTWSRRWRRSPRRPPRASPPSSPAGSTRRRSCSRTSRGSVRRRRRVLLRAGPGAPRGARRRRRPARRGGQPSPRPRAGWRRWAVLIGASGAIDSCEHTDADGRADPSAALVDSLVAEGYRVATADADHARAIVAAAARLTAGEHPGALASAYYLGRDLLELGDVHMAGRPRVVQVVSTVGRAVELIATGEHIRALALLARCDAARRGGRRRDRVVPGRAGPPRRRDPVAVSCDRGRARVAAAPLEPRRGVARAR